LKRTYVGSRVLNIGPITSMPPDFKTVFNSRGFYMGVVDGATPYGEVIYAGAASDISPTPRVAADPRRRSLTVQDWMSEFFDTTSQPVGHGFTRPMADEEFACYHFYPKADIPIKVIVLDDTDKIGCGAAASLDKKRYNWLVKELDAGERAGELMIICAHIPIRPYEIEPPRGPNPLTPYMTTFSPSSVVTESALLAKLHTYKNLIMWMSGHIHRNTITPQPSPDGNPEYGFWEVETPSLRDFPQQFRRFDLQRNSSGNISIFALDVDVAANPAPLGNGSASPAWLSRSYAVANSQIFGNPAGQGPNVDPYTGVYNAELVKQLSPEMQAKIAQISPVARSFTINNGSVSTKQSNVSLSATVTGSAPAEYIASESPSFSGAVWLPYSPTCSFTLSPIPGTKTVYFKVRDASERESAIVHNSIFKT